MIRREKRPSVVVDALAGVGAGLAASWAMSAAYKPIMRAGSEETLRREREAQAGLPPATIRAAEAAARAVGTHLPRDRKVRALGGKAVHYGYGAMWGAAFAVAARALPGRAALPVASGVAFGVVVWLLSDEVLVPLFGFSRLPARYPATSHLKGLAAHLVYGLATDAAWRAARAPLR
jgi:uncharacterized membrane protein YagU involved in acid resistance